MFRVATIFNEHFKRDVAVDLDPRRYNDEEEQEALTTRDKLWVGIYTVKSVKDQQRLPGTSLRTMEKDLKIFVLLCYDDYDQADVMNAGFTICGNYLCFQLPSCPVVNVIDLDFINSIKSSALLTDEDELRNSIVSD